MDNISQIAHIFNKFLHLQGDLEKNNNLISFTINSQYALVLYLILNSFGTGQMVLVLQNYNTEIA